MGSQGSLTKLPSHCRPLSLHGEGAAQYGLHHHSLASPGYIEVRRTHTGDVRRAPTRVRVRRRRCQAISRPAARGGPPRGGCTYMDTHTPTHREPRRKAPLHPITQERSWITWRRQHQATRPVTTGLFPHRRNSVNPPAGPTARRREALVQPSEASKPATSQRDAARGQLRPSPAPGSAGRRALLRGW